MTTDRTPKTVFVTGASGFVAIHCTIQLLDQGYRVRGTLRNPARQDELRATLAQFTPHGDRLELVQADLLDDAGWEAAAQGCDYALHVASPFPLTEPEDENDLIRPAREGTLRVLRACAAAGVRRVVLTSSIAAVSGGHPPTKTHFDESDWSNAESSTIGAYAKSKTLAERAAWDFMHTLGENHPMTLSVINPGLILGPLPDRHARSSGELVMQILRGQPGAARVQFHAVDVRDVAAAHLAAMTAPQAAGQRYLCVAESFWMKEAAVILKKHFGGRGYPVRTAEFPSWAVRLLAMVNPAIRPILPMLDQSSTYDTTRIRRDLGWQPRGLEEMLISMGESLIEMGLV
ncbi:MAG: aldehyde reductase [Anaerolineales bacterium]